MSLNIGELTGYLDLDDTGWTSGLDGALSAAKTKLGGAFPKIAGAAGAAAAVALSAGFMAADVEAGTDKLAAQLGLTAREAERIGGLAGDLYASGFGGSLDEVNDAVAAVVTSIKGMRNASDAQLSSMTGKVLDFAKAFEVDTARAAQIAGQMISSGLARNGTQAMDLLTASMQRVPAAVRDDLLDAIDEYGPFMQSIGIKGQEAMSLLVKGAEKGMYGLDKTGDALKEFTIRATDMSASTKKAYKTLGMDAESMTNKLLAGGAKGARAFDKIVRGLLSIENPAKRSQAALALFGTPLEDLSVSEMPKFLQSLLQGAGGLGNFQGAAKRMGNTLRDNATTNLTSFGRQAKVAFVDVVGGMVLPALNATASYLAAAFGPALAMVGAVLQATVVPALQWFGQLLANNMGVVQALGAVIGAVLVAKLVRAGVAATVSAGRQVAAWAMLNTAGLKAMAQQGIVVARMVAGWVMMGVRAMASAVRMAAAWVVAMGPIGWVIAAVVGLVVLIIAKWDTVKRVTVKVWHAIVAGIKRAWQAIKGAVVAAGKAVWGAIRGAWNAVQRGTRVAWDAVKSVVRAVWSAIVSVIRGYINMVLSVVGKVGDIAGKFRDWFGRAKDAALAKLGQLLSWLGGLPGRMVRAVGNLGRTLWNAGRELIGGLIDGIKSMIGSVGDAIGGVADKIKGFLPGSPVKEGPLVSWNNGGAGKRLVSMLAEGLLNTSPVDAAMRHLSDRMAAPGLSGSVAAVGGRTAGLQLVREREVIDRRGPLIGNVNQQAGEDADTLAERLWFKTRTRG